MGVQLSRATKSRTKAARGSKGKRIWTRQLVHCISRENLEQLIKDTEKGTKFKGELRRKALNELARRDKQVRLLNKTKPKRNKPTGESKNG